MSDYGEPITTANFLYRKTVYYTNPYATFQRDIIAKLILNEENFNFGLANSAGIDFRLLDGNQTLKMWIAYWSVDNKHAVLFFKIPSIGASATVAFEAYWGNEEISTDPSEPDDMGFVFYETFDSSPLSSSKWEGSISNEVSEYGYIIPSVTYPFNTTTNPFYGFNSWVLEAGVHCAWDNTSDWGETLQAVAFSFTGTENDFHVRFAKDNKIYSNARDTINSVAVEQDYGGLEGPSYNGILISYYEPEDKVTAELSDRSSFNDTQTDFFRAVEGDTRILNVEVQGYSVSALNSGPNPNYITWLIVREYSDIAISEIDGSDLYVPYERIDADPQDERTFQDDFTSVGYKHGTTFSGTPDRLSNNAHDSDTDAWVSGSAATAEDYVAVTIHTGWGHDVTSMKYIHYDSGHTYFYNASKLSDNDSDRYDRNYWHCDDTTGWAAIKFTETHCIGAIAMAATDNLDACPKDFIFYGSNYNPVIDFSAKKTLLEGTFERVTDLQYRVVEQDSKYRYYILEVLNTYGNENIRIQEWEMMDTIDYRSLKCPSQLRLHPSIYDTWIYNFPKQICFQGTRDGVNWVDLIPWRNTYTPFNAFYTEDGLWQKYSFMNYSSYWSFRLLCRGNWGADDSRIIIGEWSMHELDSELYTERIVAGQTNFMQQIWANEDCGINDIHSLFFVTNEKINKISGKILAGTEDLPDYYEDLNVIQENE